jgi:outer membrane protein assembly factor BamB
MNIYQYNDLEIKIFNDSTYKFGSADNNSDYLKWYFGDNAQEYPTSKHGIKVYKDDLEINSCVIIGSGGGTGIFDNSTIIDNQRLLICCCDTLFCLSLSDLELIWKTKVDDATCFQVFKLNEDYLTYGEIYVSRLDKDGKIKWQFGGADIFVSIDNSEPFIINKDHLILTDFCGTKYKIDFNGSIIK